MRAYALEAQVALAAVQSASLAARSLQRDIAVTKAAFQKEDFSGTGFGVSPVTAGDFMVQVCKLLAYGARHMDVLSHGHAHTP